MLLQLDDLRGVAIQLIASAAVVGVLYAASKGIYNIYFHPLAKFPGPKRAAISHWWYVRHWLGGRYAYELEELHRKYGPVVRYSPDDLDFATPQSYIDVHGHATRGKPTFRKSLFYDFGPQIAQSIVTLRDPAEHREVRRSLSHAFSAKALRLQTDVILHYVNMFTDQLQRLANIEEGVSANEWYNWLTFDIIGDLAFGESFGAVENAKTHPWVRIVINGIFAGALVDALRRLPVMKLAPQLLIPLDMGVQRKAHLQLTMEKVKRRMGKENNRDDFFSHLLSDKAVNVTPDFLRAQASSLINAGSETTATFLTGTTYYLLKAPATLQHLTQEIRTAFPERSMINGDSTQGLPYLFAVMEEGLRIFPPVPAGFSRESPGALVDGHYVPKGYLVSTSGWSTTHNEFYFRNAREFHPERWLPEDHPLYDPAYKNDVKEASRPFILGPRGCLGINLAYMEMRIILARIMWEFDLELMNPELDWERETELKILWKKPEVRVRFRPAVRA